MEIIANKFKDEKKKTHFLLIAFVAFLLVLIFLVYTSLGGSITGNVVKDVVQTEGVGFNAQLGVPDLNLKGSFSKIIIKAQNPSILVEGDNFVSDRETIAILEDFTGKIYFNQSKITALKGEAKEVSINDVYVSPQKDSLGINIREDFNYDSLNIEQGVAIDSFEYVTSGKINIENGKQILEVHNEKVSLSDFYGGLKIMQGSAFFDGYILNLQIEGDSKVSISN